MTLCLSLTFSLLTDGGCPTPLLPFRVRAIQSFVGHAISIISNMVATSKQLWNRMLLVYQRLPMFCSVFIRIE